MPSASNQRSHQRPANAAGRVIQLDALGQLKSSDGAYAVLFNCRTRLVETFRTRFPKAFTYQGNRAILLDPSTPLAVEPLAMCLPITLTYHRRRLGQASAM